jgi:tRNA-dihydrouridine synthase 1
MVATAALFFPSFCFSLALFARGYFLRVFSNRAFQSRRAFIKRIKEELKVPVLANGDIRSFAEAQACLEATGADGVLSAEPLLSNPALFSDPPYYPPPTDGFAPIPLDGTAAVDLLIEYIEICQDYPAPFSSVRGHIWKLVGHWLAELIEFREELNGCNGSVSMDVMLDWAKRLKQAVESIEQSEGRRRPIPKKTERALAREAAEEAKRAAIAESQREEDALKGTMPSESMRANACDDYPRDTWHMRRHNR